MLFSPRIKTRELARLCRRVGISLEAGVDVRTVWAREVERHSGSAARARFRSISEAVNRGDSLAEAVAATEDFFPPLFCEMIQVGEKAGKLGEMFTRLADQYEEQISLQRLFLGAITLPLLELSAAVLIIAGYIWVLSILELPTPFGLGLSSYAVWVAVVVAGLVFIVHCIRRGVVWTEPIQRAVLLVPVLGKALETICLARLAWSMNLTLGAGMEVRQALRLSLRSARNPRYLGHIPSIDATIAGGNSIYEAFAKVAGYPREFLDTIQVGEQTGNLVESMGHLSGQYRERADAAVKTLTKLAGFGVWVIVATMITALIFQIFTQVYLAPINEALQY